MTNENTGTVYSKLANARVKLKIEKKSGKNSYSNYSYFQLEDFLPEATRVLAEEGLVAVFNINEQKVRGPDNEIQ